MLHIKLHSKDKHAKKFELHKPKYHNMKRPRVSPLPPGWDASALQGPFILLSGEGHCQGKVSCQRTQHNDPARSCSTSTTCPSKLILFNNN